MAEQPAALTKEKEKTTPFGVNLLRSQVSYRAAEAVTRLIPVLLAGSVNRICGQCLEG